MSTKEEQNVYPEVVSGGGPQWNRPRLSATDDTMPQRVARRVPLLSTEVVTSGVAAWY